MSTENKSNTPILLTVSQFAEKHNFISQSALRNHMFYSYKNNMDEFKVITKIGKRVYINESNFFKWVDSQNGGNS
jgi:hypothetical protein